MNQTSTNKKRGKMYNKDKQRTKQMPDKKHCARNIKQCRTTTTRTNQQETGIEKPGRKQKTQ